MLGFDSVAGALDALENALGDGPFIRGERFTAVDVYLGSCLNWGMQFGTVEKCAALEKYVKNLVSRPAMRRVQQISRRGRRRHGMPLDEQEFPRRMRRGEPVTTGLAR